MKPLNPNTINLSQLSEELGFDGNRKTKGWLNRRGIPYKKEGRDVLVFRWLVDFERQLEFVESLKKRFPSTWAKIYEAASDDIKMVKAVFAVHSPQLKVVKIRVKKNERRFIK